MSPVAASSASAVATTAGDDARGRERRFVSMKAAQERTSLRKATIRRLIAAGEFPAPFRLSRGRLGFDECELAAWCASRPRHGAALGAAVDKAA
jgi:predicted DNA-binding transcriptional regulator AlpA